MESAHQGNSVLSSYHPDSSQEKINKRRADITISYPTSSSRGMISEDGDKNDGG